MLKFIQNIKNTSIRVWSCFDTYGCSTWGKKQNKFGWWNLWRGWTNFSIISSLENVQWVGETLDTQLSVQRYFWHYCVLLYNFKNVEWIKIAICRIKSQKDFSIEAWHLSHFARINFDNCLWTYLIVTLQSLNLKI